MQQLRTCIAAIIGFLSSAWFMSEAIADAEPLIISNQLSVESAYVSNGTVGESAKVEFRIINDSVSTVVLLGASTPVAENSRLVGRVDISDIVVFDSISVPKQETLDLTTSHMWFELWPLRQPLLPGDVIQLTLHFTQGDLSVDVHVHP